MKPEIEVTRLCNTNNSFANLPELVLYKIFSYLHTEELVRAGRVCSRWHVVSRYEVFWKEVDISGIDLTPRQVVKLLRALPRSVSVLRICCPTCPRKQQDPIFTAMNAAGLKKYCPCLETLIIENALLTTYKSDPDFEVEILPKKVGVLSLRGSIFRADYFFSNINACVNIKVMDFTYCLCLRDHHLSCFSKLTNLEELYLAGCPIYNSGIMYLLDSAHNKGLLKLKILDLEGTEINDESIILLQRMLPTLVELYLGRTRVSFSGFPFVGTVAFPSLHTVCLQNTTFTCALLKALSQVKSLKYIDLASSEVSRGCFSDIDVKLKEKFRFKDDSVKSLYCDHFMKRNAKH